MSSDDTVDGPREITEESLDSQTDTEKKYPNVKVEIRIEGGIQYYSVARAQPPGIFSEEMSLKCARMILKPLANMMRRLSGLNGMLKLIQRDSVGIEIGAHYGDSSVWFLAQGLSQLHIVDPYVNETVGDKWTGPGVDAKLIENRMNLMLDRTSGLPVTHHRMKSDEFFEKNPDLRADWVYVDGDHNYGQVLRDAENSWKSIGVGGFLFFDDLHDPNWGDDIERAVDEFLDKHEGEYYILHSSSDPFIIRRDK